MSDKRSLAEAMSAVSAVAFRGKSGTMARIDPEETVVSDHARVDADAPETPTTTGTMPILKAAAAITPDADTFRGDEETRSEGWDAHEAQLPAERPMMHSLTVDVNHDVALQDEAAVPDVFGPRARAASLPDGRGEIRMAMSSSPKLRPLTYSVLADSERKIANAPAPEGALSLGKLAGIFFVVLLASGALSYWLIIR
jgi:hypothetical protein